MRMTTKCQLGCAAVLSLSVLVAGAYSAAAQQGVLRSQSGAVSNAIERQATRAHPPKPEEQQEAVPPQNGPTTTGQGGQDGMLSRPR